MDQRSPTPDLPEALVEKILEKLGLSAAPSRDLAGLRELYAAWCRRVPFENVRKLVWLHEEIPGPLPGDDPADFFAYWLEHGTGGTCWAGNGALHALLASLGFAARRGVATMLARPGVPPNHGTVAVELEGDDYLVDASMLFDEPVPLVAGAGVEHPAWGVRLEDRDGKLTVLWRPFFLDGLDCRIEHLDAPHEEFQRWHEFTRSWGPFNFSLSARLIAGDRMIGAAFGPRAEIDAEGVVRMFPFEGEDAAEARIGFLVDQLGISEELARRLPPDREPPPPPK
jgi:N-hydroxyarylamine O-acetyltransferase